MLALGTGVDVESGREDHVRHVVGDVPQLLVLLDRARERDEEEEDPGDTDLGKHFQVDGADTGVEGDAHEMVIHPVSAQSEGFASPVEESASQFDEEGAGEGCDQGDGHELSKVFHDPWESVDASLVEDETGDQAHIPRGESVAFVGEDLVVQRGDGEAVLLDTREKGGKGELDDGETEVGFEGEFGWVRALV